MLNGSYYQDQSKAQIWYNQFHLKTEDRLWLEMNSGEKMQWIDRWRKTNS